MSVGCSQGRQDHSCTTLAGGTSTCVTCHPFLGQSSFPGGRPLLFKDRPLSILSTFPELVTSFILWRCIRREGGSKRGKLLWEMRLERTFCPSFSSMRKKKKSTGHPRWVWVCHNNTSHHERQFFIRRQVHTKLLAFRSISRKNNGQLKRRDGHECTKNFSNSKFPTKFVRKKLYAWKYQLQGYPQW